MALELVGEALLSASLELLLDRMASQDVMDFIRGKKLDQGLFNKLKIMLLSANRVLNDAEMKQLTDRDVRKRLNELKDAIYNAEDLVYEINTEALRYEIQSQSGSHTLFQVRNFFSSRITVKNVEARIVEILNTLEFLMEQKKHLGLVEGSVQTRPFPRLSAATLVEESDIYGRDADKEAIIKLLLSESDEASGGSDRISVISIVGMGGIGKTTLAQSVYRTIDDRIMTKPFDIKAWITVSEESDVFTLTKAIYEAFTNSENCTVKETFQLQLKLKVFLEGKKFLLVLDDVWNLNYKCWYDLKSSFESAGSGSKIIATTRIIEIASIMAGAPNQYQLKGIPNEDCWRLFEKHALGNVQPSVYQKLEKIGREIVQKCKGLPLAIKSLGGLLRTEQDPKYWENILKNDTWNLGKCDILPALWLSYYYLPSHLKRCFAYCSIFPKDYELEMETLILLWMAQDLLQPQETKTPEEVGEEYFKDLISRSFILTNQDGEFTMHDLVHDLAKFVSGQSCLSLDADCSSVLVSKTRHFSYQGHKSHNIKKILGLGKNKVLRTLLLLDQCYEFGREKYLMHPQELQSLQYLRVLSADAYGYSTGGHLIMKTLLLNRCTALTGLPNSIGNLKLLRYLNISGAQIKELPDTICALYNLQTLLLNRCTALTGLPNSIGNLKHLRYLDLTSSSIEKVPESLCNLHELHTLILSGCRKLTHLPSNITKLINLRHLDILGTSLREMPPEMSNLKGLQRLDEFVIGKDSGSNIKELGKLQNLHGHLCIRGLENVINVEDVSQANVKDKKCLTSLRLKWSGYTDDPLKAREVLGRLQPHSNLERLSIENYGGLSFPPWVGHRSFSCIKSVELSDCKNCYLLPPLGRLTSLEVLGISGFEMVERIGDEFYSDSDVDGSSSSVITKPFQSLKRLGFFNMAEWREWSLVKVEGGVFSNVKKLFLEDCPKLKEACLPNNLPSLEDLRIWENDHLIASLSKCRYPSLGLLGIYRCPKTKTFPKGRLPSNIHTIQINQCNELVSLSEEGWPSNLKSLEIRYCEKLFAHTNSMKWNLGMLTSLTTLIICSPGDVLDTFPEEEGQLPTSLTSLYLLRVPNLKSLNGKALRHITSLQRLQICDCQQLQCLPEEGLPASLSDLNIDLCPLLKPRCQRGTGEDWPKIQHIQSIQIDYEDI
ncbi:putative disease resistance RPP13-like protein 1 isoform X2 [Ziziphus jujuba]|uniref:Disease resistance RPP13-like protein 1 isoform X2 n=1 Tax=Ziziphus jujuba TaxID=326968 RepID=A0ABM4A1A9_ZIZJJ|nr:putative disease resistance RPP13-like protein 1 isoform X2 [Ziziphus jujuba]